MVKYLLDTYRELLWFSEALMTLDRIENEMVMFFLLYLEKTHWNAGITKMESIAIIKEVIQQLTNEPDLFKEMKIDVTKREEFRKIGVKKLLRFVHEKFWKQGFDLSFILDILEEILSFLMGEDTVFIAHSLYLTEVQKQRKMAERSEDVRKKVEKTRSLESPVERIIKGSTTLLDQITVEKLLEIVNFVNKNFLEFDVGINNTIEIFRDVYKTLSTAQVNLLQHYEMKSVNVHKINKLTRKEKKEG